MRTPREWLHYHRFVLSPSLWAREQAGETAARAREQGAAYERGFRDGKRYMRESRRLHWEDEDDGR